MKKALLILLIWPVACRNVADKKQAAIAVMATAASIRVPDNTVLSTDTSLQLQNGVWYYRQQLFSGWIETYFTPNRLKARQGFYLGKEEGTCVTYYENGNRDAERYYHLGEKDSVHRGWWVNGQRRFTYHFKMGNYDGDFEEWYVSGKPMKRIVYKEGKEQNGVGWRESGKIYMSFVMRDGRLYGMINPNLCYALKNEKGEYVNSPK